LDISVVGLRVHIVSVKVVPGDKLIKKESIANKTNNIKKNTFSNI
jgi:hypothetical protein